jgi:hypothetical protein
MILVVALVITPGPYHRIVTEGHDDQRIQRLTGIIACYALLPFAVALGIDVYMTLERPLGLWSAIVAGLQLARQPRSAAEDIGSVACRSPQERSQFGAGEASVTK